MADKHLEEMREVKEILSVVSTEVPKLISALSESLFGGEQTSKYAAAVADFYKKLREAGMNEKEAFDLTKEFMNKTNLAGMFQDILGIKGRPGGKKVEEDIGAVIEEAIKGKIKKKFEEKGAESDEE